MLDLTAYAMTPDRLETELATARRVVDKMAGSADRRTLECYIVELETELALLNRARPGLAA